MAVAICSLLAGMLVPAVTGAREMADSATCISNLHNVGIAMHAYAATYRGYVPRGNTVYWYTAFLPFLSGGGDGQDFRGVKVYRCPSYPDPRQTVCYVDNSWRFSGPTDNYGREINPPQPLMNVEGASSTIYLCDNSYGSWRPIITGKNDSLRNRNDAWTPTHLSNSTHEGSITYSRRCARDRHRNGLNVLYFDAHTEWIESDAMTVDMWRDDRW